MHLSHPTALGQQLSAPTKGTAPNDHFQCFFEKKPTITPFNWATDTENMIFTAIITSFTSSKPTE